MRSGSPSKGPPPRPGPGSLPASDRPARPGHVTGSNSDVTRARVVPGDWREMARSIVPLGLLALGAALPLLRLPSSWHSSRGRRWRSPGRHPFAGRGQPGSRSRQASRGASCPAPRSRRTAPIAGASRRRRRSGARPRRSSCWPRWPCLHRRFTRRARHSGCGRPSRDVVRWSVIGFVVVGPLALVLGPILARPFFGEISYDVTVVGAFAPALVFAVANGTMEDAWRCTAARCSAGRPTGRDASPVVGRRSCSACDGLGLVGTASR